MIFCVCQVCCNASQCGDYVRWTGTLVSGKSDLTITLQVPSECVGKQLYGLRYLWRETPSDVIIPLRRVSLLKQMRSSSED